ncbi:MAG: xanthine dehydrogenase family protein molybdopterin-binding subunit [Pseudomonadota bacterium]
MHEYGLGRAVPRTEDARLLRGLGRYVDDLSFPGLAHMHVVRSPHAAARFTRIGTEAATAAPGVLKVLNGGMAEAAGLGTLVSRVRRARPDGTPNFEPPYRVLALERVRHVGDPVAAVIATSLGAAKDAAELLEIDYEPLPAVTATAAATWPGAPAVWDEAPDNVCFLFELGDKAAVEAAMARAARVVRLDYTISRVSANPLEPRTALGLYDPADERFTLYAGLQAPHAIRSELAGRIFGVPENRVRVVSPDVGGAFGMKGSIFPELALVLWAAKETGRPVKWICERSEAFVGDHHARDNVSTAELALDADGKFLALSVRTTANLGAYLSTNGLHNPTNNLGGLAGVYTTPHIYVAVSGVFSNTNPTAPYRGAGRPEASYGIERVIDVAAAEIGLDPAELRRRNLIPPAAMPYKTGLVYTYDSGEFEQHLDQVLALSDWANFEARRGESGRRARLRGRGLACVIEIAGGPFAAPLEEGAEIRFDPTGGATIFVGTHSHGQGHETMYRQMAAEFLGLAPEGVRVVYGDTDLVYHGHGSFGSRSASVGGFALRHAADKIVARGQAIAAHLLEAAETDIEFAGGRFFVAGTDRGIGLVEVAQASFLAARLPRGFELGLTGAAVVAPPGPTFPNGSHVCEVEIDPETGTVEVVGYWVVDDVGRVVNPLLLEGQIHGGVAQGVGQALGEEIVYDERTGQLLSGSFMDYRMPRAADLPMFEVGTHDVPAKTNPLGIKGAGEAGTVGALPATMNAICDALRRVGVRSLDMPAAPERVWRAIAAAKEGTAGGGAARRGRRPPGGGR